MDNFSRGVQFRYLFDSSDFTAGIDPLFPEFIFPSAQQSNFYDLGLDRRSVHDFLGDSMADQADREAALASLIFHLISRGFVIY